jgi:CheY-like chemotaxis protein
MQNFSNQNLIFPRNTTAMARVLIVEDNPSCRALAERLLIVAARHDVVCAGSPQEALDAFSTHQPDLVIMDLALRSDVTGKDLIIAFKRSLSPPRILALSAFNETFCAEQTLSAGADRFMAKPYSPKDFLDAVATLLA